MDRAVSKWTRVGAPPTLHDLQMDKGWGPPNPSRLGAAAPQPSTTCKWTRVGPPPNPSRLANRQGLGAPPTPHDLGRQGPPTLHDKWTRLGTPTLHDLQTDKGWAPQPFTTCKWTRVGPQPLTRAPQPFATCKFANGQGLGPPTLHDLQMDKGWGPPNPSRLGAAGHPNPSRLANGQGLSPPQPFTTCKSTWGGRAPNPSGLEAAEPSTRYDLGWRATNPSPKIGKPVTGPFGPELSPNAKPKFSSWCDVWVRLGRIWFGWLDGLPRCE